MSDERPPDFAMLRAVEILAKIYERGQTQDAAPVPASEVPIVAFTETLSLSVGVTKRDDVERAFGIAFAYPSAGWHTYAVRSSSGARTFLSLFFSKGVLAAVELYAPKSDRAPNLTSRDMHVRLVPGELEVGIGMTSLTPVFAQMTMPQAGRANFDAIFEARFPGGVAYAMGNAGVIERLALYVLSSSDAQA